MTLQLVLTNDDGIQAAGLAALERAAGGLGQVTVVAPLREWSGCGHRVTTHAPLKVERRGERRYGVDGTPADCVRIALHALVPDCNWVLAGINHGGNLGADVCLSGTVSAAREAALHGRRALAASLYHRHGRPPDWEAAERWLKQLLPGLIEHPPALGRIWNVNLPHLDPGQPAPRVVPCVVDASPLPLDYHDGEGGWHYRGNYHQRARRPGQDIDVCFGGAISVSELGMW